MTLSEYQGIIKLLDDDNKRPEAIVNLNDNLLVDITKLEALEEKVTTLETANASLRDTNSELALRITAPVTPSELPKPETDEEKFDRLFNSHFN